MMTNSNYRLLPARDEYVQVSIYLNRVHLDGYTPDRAIAQLIEMGSQQLTFYLDLPRF
jgi:hypothetical protein